MSTTSPPQYQRKTEIFYLVSEKSFVKYFFFNFGEIVEWERRDYWVVASDQKAEPPKIQKQVK